MRRRTFLEAGVAGLAVTSSARGERRVTGHPDLTDLRAIVFDVFGTVVDWRRSVAREVEDLARRKHRTVDGVAFADAWRAEYGPSMNRVRTGALPWTRLDRLHRMSLDQLLIRFALTGLSEEETADLNRAWHRLDPWPDVVTGLRRLRPKYILAPLSNGNIALMTNLARHANLPWDCILGAELVRRYKPDPEVYRSAPDFLDLEPEQVLMVAAHLGDLRGARAAGLRTAFVPRPLEYGPGGDPDRVPEPWIDLTANDFNDLADRLAA